MRRPLSILFLVPACAIVLLRCGETAQPAPTGPAAPPEVVPAGLRTGNTGDPAINIANQARSMERLARDGN
jgi:hypothetical protein